MQITYTLQYVPFLNYILISIFRPYVINLINIMLQKSLEKIVFIIKIGKI